MNLQKIFDDKDKFVRFYEKLQYELDGISDEEIAREIKILEFYNEEKIDYSKMDKLSIIYHYSLLS